MCLVHDLAESIVGDLTPQDNVPKVEKAQMENLAFEKLYEFIKDNENSDHFKKLVDEYTAHSSLEAKYVKNLDLFDMYLQAYEYEQLNDVKLDEFPSIKKICNFFKRLFRELLIIQKIKSSSS